MQFFERIAQLENERVPFALAIVVSRKTPVSSHVGDRAIVFADGRMEGFVGGSCSRDVVRRHGVDALRTGVPRMLHISPEAHSPDDPQALGHGEHVFVPMSCASEGAVEVYVEPHLPARRLIVAGHTPVAEALAGAAAVLDFDVVRAVASDEIADLADGSQRTGAFSYGGPPVVTLDGLRTLLDQLTDSERARTAAVVVSLGRYDEAALGTLLDAELGFVGLVASRKRAARVFGVLAQEGRSRERLATVRNPVGLDIGARTSAGVAVSILAEIVAATSQGLVQPADAADEGERPASALDPICGMDVEIEGARHRFDFDGRTYYFCGAGCRAAFVANPVAAPASVAAD